MKKAVRSLILRALRVASFDISLRHHWAPGRKLRLNSFRHRNYWLHGRSREPSTMALLERMIRPGQTVIDVGAHIGYLSVLIREHIGPSGTLICFEPGEENARYLRRNVAGYDNVIVEQRAVSDDCGEGTLFVEELSGQNNSLIPDLDILAENAAHAGLSATGHPVTVTLDTLDAYCARNGIRPDWLKIDVEGVELRALRGASRLLASVRPILLLEISHDHDEIGALIEAANYRIFDDSGRPYRIDPAFRQNYLVVPAEKVAALGLAEA